MKKEEKRNDRWTPVLENLSVEVKYFVSKDQLNGQLDKMSPNEKKTIGIFAPHDRNYVEIPSRFDEKSNAFVMPAIIAGKKADLKVFFSVYVGYKPGHCDRAIGLTRLEENTPVFSYLYEKAPFRFYRVALNADGFEPIYAASVTRRQIVNIILVDFPLVNGVLKMVQTPIYSGYAPCGNKNDFVSLLVRLGAKQDTDTLTKLAKSVCHLYSVACDKAEIPKRQYLSNTCSNGHTATKTVVAVETAKAVEVEAKPAMTVPAPDPAKPTAKEKVTPIKEKVAA